MGWEGRKAQQKNRPPGGLQLQTAVCHQACVGFCEWCGGGPVQSPAAYDSALGVWRLGFWWAMREKAGDESALWFVCFGREVGVCRGCVLLVLMLEKQSVRMQYLTRSTS